MKFVILRSKRVGEAAPVLEAAEHALDDVALLVDGSIVVVLDLRFLRGGITAWVPRSSSQSRNALLS